MTNKHLPQSKQILRCLVVDDEETAIEGIEDYIENLDFLKLVATSASALEAIEILKNENIDLMFLDINMPQLSGLELLETLENKPLTILTTAYSEYAIDGFRLEVVDYLLKPYSLKRFLQATQKAFSIWNRKERKNDGQDFLFLRQGNSFHKISWRDILYVEAMQNYLKVHLEQQSFIIHQTMSSLCDTLPQTDFFRIHNSFLVNTNKITVVSGKRLFINQKELPISKHRKQDFLEAVVYKQLISK